MHASLGGAGESGGKNHVALHDVGVQINTRGLDSYMDNDNRDMADGYMDSIPSTPWMRRGRLLWARRHRTGMMTQAGGSTQRSLMGWLRPRAARSTPAVLSLVAIGGRMRGQSGSGDHLDGRGRFLP